MTIEHDGQERLNQLIQRRNDPILNELERKFIVDVIGKNYAKLNSHEKAVVNRIYGWLTSSHDPAATHAQ